MTDERSERLRQRLRRRQQRAAELEGSDPGWGCGIGDCTYFGDTVEELVTHQAHDHPSHTCKVCNREIPDGFIAIYHAFEEHGRTEYVKAYDASSEEVRQREEVKAMIEEHIDVPSLLQDLKSGPEHLNP